MITAGIDAGSQTLKALVLKDGTVLSWSSLTVGPGINELAEQALAEARDRARITPTDVERVIATGAGRDKVRFADERFADLTCDARGAVWLYPAARTVIDVGAEECRVLRCDGKGRVQYFNLNDKCAASVGMFLEIMAKVLDVPREEAGPLSLKSEKSLSLSTSCVVFAESEVVSLIHTGEAETDVLRAVNMAVASTAAGILRRVGLTKEIVLIGGVARNIGFVDCLKQWIETDILIPENPEIVGALGAALMAAERENGD